MDLRGFRGRIEDSRGKTEGLGVEHVILQSLGHGAAYGVGEQKILSLG